MEEVLVIDQRDPAAQKTVKVRSPAATPLTAARLAKKYAKFAGSPDFVLTRPSGARLAAGDAVPSTVFVEAADDRVCRFCYDGAAEDAALVAPCGCKGDQRWVHAACLRRWRRALGAREPTHPALYAAAADPRAAACGVCTRAWNVPPEARHDAAAACAGPALAARIRVGTLLAVDAAHSRRLARQPDCGDFVRSARATGVRRSRKKKKDAPAQKRYLVVNVERDDGTLALSLSTNAECEALRRRLDARGRAVLENGREFELRRLRRCRR